MNRNKQWAALDFQASDDPSTPLISNTTWDLVIIGGGATGLGTAVDAASRGLKTLLLERDDFGKGTSSRSTKLVHGGVRYLAQGNIKLVREALRERAHLLKNAPHLSHTQSFVIPAYSWFDRYFYYFGLLCYDLLAGKLSLGATKLLNRQQTLEALPALAGAMSGAKANQLGLKANGKKLKGGILYTDGQFDDARLCVELAATAIAQGATILNAVAVKDLIKDEKGKIVGVVAVNEINHNFTALDAIKSKASLVHEQETWIGHSTSLQSVSAEPAVGTPFSVRTKVVVNATGVFVDPIRQMESGKSKSLVSPSQGIHLVVHKKYFPGNHALMIPKTADGRVLFAVPWQDHIVLGTTDTPLSEISDEPRALDNEIEFVLDHFNQYTGAGLQRKQVGTVFAGLRPLVKIAGQKNTALLARDHTIEVSPGQLITVTGGKWTTYRKMAEDVVNNVIFVAKFKHAGPCVTRQMALGRDTYRQESISKLLREHPTWSAKLHPDFGYCVADVVWAVREEMALTAEDVMARRLRLLFLDARAAMAAAPQVIHTMAIELNRNQDWEKEELENFLELAKGYVLT